MLGGQYLNAFDIVHPYPFFYDEEVKEYILNAIPVQTIVYLLRQSARWLDKARREVLRISLGEVTFIKC